MVLVASPTVSATTPWPTASRMASASAAQDRSGFAPRSQEMVTAASPLRAASIGDDGDGVVRGDDLPNAGHLQRLCAMDLRQARRGPRRLLHHCAVAHYRSGGAQGGIPGYWSRLECGVRPLATA